VCCFDAFPDGTVAVVRWLESGGRTTLTTAHADGAVRRIDLGDYPERPVAFRRGDWLFLVTSDAVEAADPATGKRAGRRARESDMRVGAFGFFRYQDSWYYPTVEHDRVILRPLNEKRQLEFRDAVDLFQRPGDETVYAFKRDWSVVSIHDQVRRLMIRPKYRGDPDGIKRLSALSTSGRYLQVETVNGAFVVNLEDGDQFSSGRKNWANDAMTPSTLSYRTRIASLGFDESSRVMLGVPEGQTIVLERLGPLAMWRTLEDGVSATAKRAFAQVKHGDRVLRKLQLTDSCAALVDDRGLLHLYDASGRLPDVTVTLFACNENAAWSSRLGGVGNPYCFGDRIPYPNDWSPFMQAIGRYGVF
jgi:hypothetical protein